MLRTLVTILVAIGLTWAADFNQVVEKRFDARNLKKVVVLNTNGNINIKGGSSDQVLLVAHKMVNGRDSEKEHLLKALEIQTDEKDGILTITVKRSKNRKGFFSWLFDLDFGEQRVDFDLTLPEHLKIKAHSTNGQIEAYDFAGQLDLVTTNGEIKATHVQKVKELHSTNGNVEVDFERLPEGQQEIEIGTTNGEITLIVPEQARFNVRAFTTNGRINYDLPYSGKMQKSKSHLEVENGRDLPTFFLKTTNGDINIHGRM